MEQEKFSDYLTGRYEYQTNWYDKKAVTQQKVYRWMQWSVIVLAALTPFLIEINLDKLIAKGFDHLPTVMAAVVAILTAGLKTFKYQENWINYRTTCELLRKEKHYYDAGIADYGTTSDKDALFVDRVESLISRENTLWVTAQKPETKSAA